ncbi:hypothetical protein [Roseimaritima sediminicola]|uniref:hypothetical protein n=1 Tax=Roseimaritima sediminicola TaxID=2662066 RepID=UPI0012985171|nr:hypothetical protein [Roseimaritima sediminicola]
MSQVACPRCDETIRVPEAMPPADASAKCPWCHETFSFGELENRMPPMLQWVDSDGEPIPYSAGALVGSAAGTSMGTAYEDPSAAGASSPTTDSESLGWSPEPSHEEASELGGFQAFSDSESDSDAPAEFSAPAVGAADDAAEINTLDQLDSVGPARRGFEAPAMRPHRRSQKSASPLKTMIQMLLGGAVAIPLTGVILYAIQAMGWKTFDFGFYPFDGTAGGPRRTAAAPMDVDPPTQPQPSDPDAAASPPRELNDGVMPFAANGSEREFVPRSLPGDPDQTVRTPGDALDQAASAFNADEPAEDSGEPALDGGDPEMGDGDLSVLDEQPAGDSTVPPVADMPEMPEVAIPDVGGDLASPLAGDGSADPEADVPTVSELPAPGPASPADESDVDSPEMDSPDADAPETNTPEADSPETDAPETDTPEADAPETDATAPAGADSPAGASAEVSQELLDAIEKAETQSEQLNAALSASDDASTRRRLLGQFYYSLAEVGQEGHPAATAAYEALFSQMRGAGHLELMSQFGSRWVAEGNLVKQGVFASGTLQQDGEQVVLVMPPYKSETITVPMDGWQANQLDPEAWLGKDVYVLAKLEGPIGERRGTIRYVEAQ